MIKGSGDFMEGNSSLYVPTLIKLIAIDIVLTDFLKLFFKIFIVMLVCHVISQDYVIIWSCDFIGRGHSR